MTYSRGRHVGSIIPDVHTLPHPEQEWLLILFSTPIARLLLLVDCWFLHKHTVLLHTQARMAGGEAMLAGKLQ